MATTVNHPNYGKVPQTDKSGFAQPGDPTGPKQIIIDQGALKRAKRAKREADASSPMTLSARQIANLDNPADFLVRLATSMGRPVSREALLATLSDAELAAAKRNGVDPLDVALANYKTARVA